jgi:hypothetical protein
MCETGQAVAIAIQGGQPQAASFAPPSHDFQPAQRRINEWHPTALRRPCGCGPIDLLLLSDRSVAADHMRPIGAALRNAV